MIINSMEEQLITLLDDVVNDFVNVKTGLSMTETVNV